MRITPFVLLGSALAAASVAQAQQTRALSKPDVEFPEPFTIVSSLRELRDGRVVVADAREKTLQLIDLKSGSAAALGREGSGPAEYGLPMSVLAMPGDTTFVFDPLNQRYLIVADGKATGTWSMAIPDVGGPPTPQRAAPAPEVRGGGPGVRFGGAFGGFPRGADVRGRLYFQPPNFTIGPEGPKSVDSAAITRYDRATKKTDTLTFVKVPQSNVQTSGNPGGQGGGRVAIRIGGATPFEPQDEWTVLSDGRVAVVRASDYHVDVVSGPRQKVSGPAVPYEKVKVGEAEKKAWRENQGRGTAIAITRDAGPGGARSSATAAPPASIPEPDKWPEVMPAAARNGVFGTPKGEIWVQRNRPANNPNPSFDVFDGQGRFTGKVTLPRGTRLVGFGNGTVYLARSDADDLQYLQRYRYP